MDIQRCDPTPSLAGVWRLNWPFEQSLPMACRCVVDMTTFALAQVRSSCENVDTLRMHPDAVFLPFHGCECCALQSCSLEPAGTICSCQTGCGARSQSCMCSAGTNCNLPFSDCACCEVGPQPDAWPTFQTQAELAADPWGTYAKAVYGELPPSGYPMNVGDNWLFYVNELNAAGVTRIPKSNGKCPSDGRAQYQRYDTNNFYQADDLTWSWHAYPHAASPPNTWIEVMREEDLFGDEKNGAWFCARLVAHLLYTGTTISFQTAAGVQSFQHQGGQ